MKRTIISFTTILLAVTLLSFKGGPKTKAVPSPFPGYIALENGSYFKQIVKGTGIINADSGGALFLKVKFKNQRDSLLLNVNESAKMASFPILISKPMFKGDFQDVFGKVHAGDSVALYMRLDSLKKFYPGQFDFHNAALDSLKYLGFFVKVDSVFTRAQVDTLRARETRMKAAEQAKQQKIQTVMNAIHSEASLKEPFLKAKNDSMLKPGLERLGITGKPDDEGIYFIAGKNTTGQACQLFQKVSVKYTGTYLDGTIFDSNELADGQPLLSFTLGLDPMFPGFTKCIYKMHIGERATFVLPPAAGNRDGLTRVFSVEVVSAVSNH